jgi:hypothetical protein
VETAVLAVASAPGSAKPAGCDSLRAAGVTPTAPQSLRPHGLALGVALALLAGCASTEPASGPRLAVQPDSVTLTLPEGSGAALSRVVAVTDAGSDSLTQLELTIVYGDGQAADWLTATLAGTTTPTSLTLSAPIRPLAAGAYEARVLVRSPDAADDSAVVHVLCGVTLAQCTAPVMCLSTTRLTFTIESGGLPLAQPVGVYSCGCGRASGLHTTVTYEERGVAPWLSVKKNSWRTPAALSVQAAPAGLAAGSYNGTVIVSADTAANSPQAIHVVLNVR